MNSWFERHFILTTQERLLIAGILVIALCGLGVTYCRRTADEPPPAREHVSPH